MKIKQIVLYQVDYKFADGKYSWSGGHSITVLTTAIVRIMTDAGLQGYGEVCPVGPAYMPAHSGGVKGMWISIQCKINWKRLLVDIRSHNHSLDVLLSSNCKAISASGNEITLATPYDFCKDKLNNPENRLTVESVFGKILGLKIRLKILTYKEAGIAIEAPKQEEAQETAGDQGSLIDSAMEIMVAKVVE